MPGSYHSKEDEVSKISTSIYVTNFPNQVNAKDLWNACKQYGNVVDSFIPNRRSKSGKRFGFVRFIKIFDVERLVNNLCTVWIGRHKIHANVARFQRMPVNKGSIYSQDSNGDNRNNISNFHKEKGVNGHSNSYAHVVKRRPQPVEADVENAPALVLDDSCLNQQDLSLSLMGKVKEFTSLSNLKIVLSNEGFENLEIKYMEVIGCCWNFTQKRQRRYSKIIQVEIEGVPIKIWSENTFNRIAAKWGVLLNVDDKEDGCFHRKRLCIREYKGDNRGSPVLEGDSDVEDVPEIKYEEEPHNTNLEEVSVGKKDSRSEDPVTQESAKKDDGSNKEEGECFHSIHVEEKEDVAESFCSGHFKKSKAPRTGGSILQLIDDLVKVGHTMGYNMDECIKNMEEIIDSQGVNGVISNWKGEVVTMGDFNEVCTKDERFGSVFNVQGVEAFNKFISNAGFEEVPLVEGFDKLVEDTWNEALVDESNAMINLMKRLKYLKEKLRAWNNDKKRNSSNSKIVFKEELTKLDATIDKGECNVDIVNRRSSVLKSLQEMEILQSLEAAQKAKIKWAIEGDENSKYYHGILNKKRNQLTIRAILVEGNWIDSPGLVKNEFLAHFKNQVDQPQETRIQFNMNFLCTIMADQKAKLENVVTKEEIKRAVWDCGIDKSPGPDGFTFGFYRRFWNVIKTDVVEAVTFFFRNGYFPKGGNSSFIALIPKKSDSNMVKDFRPISLIGSLYKYIAKILANRRVTVLGDIVNEVQSAFVTDRQILDGPFILNELVQCFLEKSGVVGFKGDHLSPFLFILVMESLHISFQRVVDADCFYRASGLHININKSKLMGVAVDDIKVEQAALKIGCVTLKVPFSYLGSKVRGSMSRIQSWNEIIDRVTARLSKWKMKTLSIGGRLTLLKSVLGKKPIWVKWKSVLSSKEKGCLGVSSLYALRLSKQSMELMEKIGKNVKPVYPSIWLDIIHEVEKVKEHGIDLVSYIHKKLGNGANTSFWEEIWRGDVEFKKLYPRLYALEAIKNVTVASKLSQTNLVSSFRRVPRGDVPIKVNIHAWKVRLDCLSTKLNISRRGLDIDSILCPMCESAVESSRHTFFTCHIAREIFRKVMAISVISISSNSSEDIVRTPAGRVILFGTIPTTIPDTTPVITPPATQTDTPVIPTETPIIAPTIPPSPDYTPASLDYSPASDSESDPHDDHSSSEASSDFHSDASSDTFSRHSLSDHSSPDLPSTSARPSCKRRRSPMMSVPALSTVFGALSPVRADLIPSPKRVKDSGYLADVEVDPREISLKDDAIAKVSNEPHLEQDIDPKIQAEIDECIAYADALKDRGIDARVVVEAVDRDETETGVRGPVEVRVERVTHPAIPEDIHEPSQEGAVEVTYETLGDLVQRFHDHTQVIPVHRIQAIEGVQREQGHMIVRVESAVIDLTERIAELERDNRRLKGTVSVESQRVDRLQRSMSRMQRELRQMRRLRFYDRVRVGRLEACARKHMDYRP
ncbi:RNA-directed DNA polymerase, eukaryota [Tanacetum coccineum]